MIQCRFLVRSLNLVGFSCLTATLLLMPMGVRIVRAEDGVPVRMSVEPEPTSIEPILSASPTVLPVIKLGDGPDALRPGIAGIEIEPGIILLNTNGYNYPSAAAGLDPAALEFESETP